MRLGITNARAFGVAARVLASWHDATRARQVLARLSEPAVATVNAGRITTARGARPAEGGDLP